MNIMKIFLTTIFLFLSQHIFCAHSLRLIKAYEDQGLDELLRGQEKKQHPQIRKIIDTIKKQSQENGRAKFFMIDRQICQK